MKFFKKVLLVVCLMLLITVSFSACSKSSKKDNQVNAGNYSGNMVSNADNSNTKFGKVTAIDGSKITLALLERPSLQGGPENAPSGIPKQGNRPDGNFPSGAPRRGNNQDNRDSSNGTTADARTTDGVSQGGRNTSFSETGETLDITIDDESIIKLREKRQETAGSLKDISVGSILTVNYADDESISAIIVQSSNTSANVTPK